MKPILSICIPTYNRASFLKEALQSILEQISEANRQKLEIVISDNASNDNTSVLVKEMQGKVPIPIVYRRNDENIGCDRNFLKSVEAASGKYCWLLGDDDRMAAGAIDRILSEIETNARIDVFIGNKEDFNADFSYRMRFSPLFADKVSRVYDFPKQGLDSYFKSAGKLICFFNFISILVFNRIKWLSVAGKEKFVGSGYIHVYMIMAMLWKGRLGRLEYLPDIIVSRRWGMDRISGVYKRLKGDVESYDGIAREIFDNNKYIRKINNLVIRNDGFSWAVRSKISDGVNYYAKSFPLLFRYYWSYPLFWLKFFPLLFAPSALLRFMRWSYRRLVKGELASMHED